MILRAGLAIFVLFGSPAFSAPIRVLSGEHGSFTRLVLYAEPEQEYTVVATPARLEFDFDGFDDGFDTTEVYNRVDRSRLEAIDSQAGRLSINLGCECTFTATRVGDGLVVIDIFEGELETTETEVVAETVEISVPEPIQPSAPLVVEEPAAPLLPLITGLPVATEETSSPFSEEQLTDFQVSLNNRIASAATRGFLEAALAPAELANEIVADEELAAETEPEPVDPIVDDDAAKLERNLRITSSGDRLYASDDTLSQVDGNNTVCESSMLLELSQWSDNLDFGFEISTVRNNLYTEFDRVEQSAIDDLAKRYLYFGFGAEATHVLDLSEEELPEHRILKELAVIFERGSGTGLLSERNDCEDGSYLWSFLSEPTALDVKNDELQGILRELSELPVHLRQLLVPTITDRFTDLGLYEGATIALRTVSRETHDIGSKDGLVTAILESTDDVSDLEPLEAERRNSIESARAFMIRINAKVDRGDEIVLDELDLLRSYGFQYRNHPIAEEILDTNINALASLGRTREALELIEELDFSENRGSLRDGVSKVLEIMERNADDIGFLFGVYFSIEKELPIHVSTVQKLTPRLVALGFPELHKQLTTSDVIANQSRESVEPDQVREDASFVLANSLRDASGNDPAGVANLATPPGLNVSRSMVAASENFRNQLKPIGDGGS